MDRFSRMDSIVESDSWAVNRESVRKRRRSSAVARLLLVPDMEIMINDSVAIDGVDITVDKDVNKDMNVMVDDFKEEESYLMYIYTFLNYFYVGNGKPMLWIIPVCQFSFVLIMITFTLLQYFSENSQNSSTESISKLGIGGNLSQLALQLVNFAFWYYLYATNHIKKVLMSVSQSNEERQGYLNLLAYCLIGSILASVILTLPYCFVQDKFLTYIVPFGYEGKGQVELVKFQFLWLAVSTYAPSLYIGLVLCWILYVSKKHFDKEIMDQIKYDNMAAMTDIVFSFYEKTRRLTSSRMWKFVFIFRTIITIFLAISLFEMTYYIQSLKTELQDAKSFIVEYEGKDAYYGYMKYFNEIAAILASNIAISTGAAWLPFIVAGYFNDSVQEALLSRLNFLLVLADIQAQRLQDRGQDGTGRNEKKMNATYNRQISNVVKHIDKDLGLSLDTLTSRSKYDDKDKNGDQHDDNDEEDEVNIIELYGDHRNLCRDTIFCLNNTSNGVDVAGVQMTVSLAVNFGTLITSLVGILTKFNDGQGVLGF